jgi:hypothetical protein
MKIKQIKKTMESSGGGVRRGGLGARMEVSGSSCVAHAQEEVCRVRGLTLHI